MLDYIRSLYSHQFWADDELLRAVAACESAPQDTEMLHGLRHIANAQLYLLSQMKNESFDTARFKEQLSYAQLMERFGEAHAANEAFLASLTEAGLHRPFEMPYFQCNFTLVEGMTQIILHSQNHRGQCLTRLRELGAKPPALDYILWVKDTHPRPAQASLTHAKRG
jgi:uncharacterized damage-inducible protein DinB